MKLLRILCFALALAVPVTGFSHEGEDHGDAPAPLPTAASTPRAEAQTSDFELVVAQEGPSLLLFLDNFASNEPVTGAQVEVQSGDLQATATEVGPGTYRVAGGAWTLPGTHALTISVQTAVTADLLSASLDIPAAAAPAEKAGTSLPAGRSLWMLAGAVLVFAFIAIAWLRRRRTAPS
ncbi:MAG: hypothetical protein KDF25_11945 [Burkholderiaceae bacterium]|nr:hypothetical protein [Burkholderiaceae bacterium]